MRPFHCLSPLVVFLGVVLTVPLAVAQGSDPPAPAPSTTTEARTAARALGRVAPAFEQNVGQFDGRVRFWTMAQTYGVLLTDREGVLSLGRTRGQSLTMTFAGAEPRDVRGEGERKGRIFYVSDPAKPTRGAPRFDRVRYVGAWPGTDIVFHGTDERQVRFDFELAPGADPSRIRLEFDGAERIAIDDGGDLAVAVAGETVRIRRPVVFQETTPGRRDVAGRFVLDGDRAVRFAIADFDPALRLVIDPTIDFTSYLGSGADEDVLWAESRYESAYVSGRTWHAGSFPARVPAQGDDLSSPHCFVSKFTPDGADLAWSVIFDRAGLVGHECGPFALGPDRKVHAAFRDAYSGGEWAYTVFSEPDSGTYVGANVALQEMQPDQPVRIQVDNAGNTYVLGSCNPNTYRDGDVVLPQGQRTVAYLTDCGSSGVAGNPTRYESILIKIHPDGTRLYGTFIGGTPSGSGEFDRYPDTGRALVVDPATQVAWVGGAARSADLPGTTGNLHQQCGTSYQSPGCMPNAYVARFDTNASGVWSLTYATYYGIRFQDEDPYSNDPQAWDGILRDWFSVEDLALEPGGGINLFGTIRRIRQANAPYDLFVARLDPTAPSSAQLTYEHQIFGTQMDTAVRIRRRPNGDLVLGGYTNSPTEAPPEAVPPETPLFPEIDPLPIAPARSSTMAPFLAVLRPSAGSPTSQLIFASLLPGKPPTWTDSAEPPREGMSVAVPDDTVVYAAWTTTTAGLGSTSFPTGPFQTDLAGATDAIVAKVCFSAAGCALNTPPTFPSVVTPVIVPQWASTGGFASLSLSVEDLDGDPLTVTWGLPAGTQITTASSGEVLFAYDLFPVGSSTVPVTVDDGRGGTATATIEVEVVENTPAGARVTVSVGNDTSPEGGGAITVIGDVQVAGNTFLAMRNDITPRPPTNRQLGSPPYYYDVWTTATFSSVPTVCLGISGHGFADQAMAIHAHDGTTWTPLPTTVSNAAPGMPQVCAPVALSATPKTLAIFTPEVAANRIRTLAGTTWWDPVNDLCVGPGPDPNEGGPAVNSRLHRPAGAVYDATRNALYFAEACGYRVRKVDLTTGTIHTMTGTGTGSNDGPYGVGFNDSAAVSLDPAVATLRVPNGVALDPAGNLYIADSGHCRVRKLTLDPQGGPPTSIVTVAGTGTCGSSGDGGPAEAAQLGSDLYIRTDAGGVLYISDGNRVRRIIPGPGGIDGTQPIATYAGGGAQAPSTTPTPATDLAIDRALGLAASASGDLYVAMLDGILRVDAGGMASLVRPGLGYGPVGDSLALLANGDLAWAWSGCRGWPDWQCYGRVSRRTRGADAVVNGGADEVERPLAGYDDRALLPLTTPPAPYQVPPRNSDGDGHGLSARLQTPGTIVPLPGSGDPLVIVDVDNGLLRLVGQPGGGSTNQPPTANAGQDYAVNVGDHATLDGSTSSDPENDTLTYRWTIVARPATSNASLTGATSVTALLIPDVPGLYRIQLVVNDGEFDGVPTYVEITTVNRPPVANAGPDRTVALQYPEEGYPPTTVMLDGTGSSDPDGQALTYVWTTQETTLTGADTATPLVELFQARVYTVTLTVSDGTSTSSDTVTITASNPRPTVEAGPDRSMHIGTSSTLNGTATDPNGDPIATWTWWIATSPAGSAPALVNDTTQTPSFSADTVGRYEIRVAVNDGWGAWSAPDSVFIDVTNTRPVARAGSDQSFTTFGGYVELDGAGSSDADPEDTIVQWNWSFVSRPTGSVADFSGSDTSRPTFLADMLGTYVIRLSVFDGWIWSDPDEVTVTFANQAPVAAADTATSPAGNAVVIDVLANDADTEGDEFWLTSLTQPARGTVTRLDPPAVPSTRLLYRPTDVSASGTDTFTYTIQTLVGSELMPSTATGMVTVTLVPNRPPTTGADAAALLVNGEVRIPVLNNDADADGDEFRLVSVTGGTIGVASVDLFDVHYRSTGTSGIDVLTYRIEDIDPYDQRVKSSVTGTITVRVDNTAVGSGVTLDVPDPTGAATPISVRFSNVITAGTTVAERMLAPPPSGSFSIDGAVYDITTTATYQPPVTVCIAGTFAPGTYLLHYENGQWVQLPNQWHDASGICAESPSLSPFGAGTPVNRPPTVSAGTNQVLEATSAAGAVATVSATASDPDDDPLTYTWSGGCGVASGATATLTCPLGVNIVTVSTSDGTNAAVSASLTVTVSDTTPPSIACDSADSTWHSDNVTVECTAADAVGLASSTDERVTLTTNVADGVETSAAMTSTATVCDASGNCAGAGPVGPYRIDRRAPAIAITRPGNGATYDVGQSVTVLFACTDGGAGVQACTGTLANGAVLPTDTPGDHTFVVESVDSVGNRSSASVSYAVRARTFNFTGFFGPVDNPPVVNLAKAGSAVPVRFSLGGDYGLAVFDTGFPRVEQYVCLTGMTTDVVQETVAAGASGLQYDPTTGLYIYVWKTNRSMAGTCWRLTLRFTDGTTQYALFDLRR